MNYSIKRECWNEKTYNGYTDNPYWRIEFSCYIIGLSDDGRYWGIGDVQDVKTWNVKDILNKIIDECKLKINLAD